MQILPETQEKFALIKFLQRIRFILEDSPRNAFEILIPHNSNKAIFTHVN